MGWAVGVGGGSGSGLDPRPPQGGAARAAVVTRRKRGPQAGFMGFTINPPPQKRNRKKICEQRRDAKFLCGGVCDWSDLCFFDSDL